MLNAPKNCLKLNGSIFVRFYVHSEIESAQKKILLVVYEISGLFLKILTSDEKYSLSVKAIV